VKLIATTDDGFTFELTSGEMRLLGDLLRLYPLTPESIHRISKDIVPQDLAHSQELLQEELSEHRRTSLSWLSAWMDQNLDLDLTQTEALLKLKRSELELLLQVLNDIRVGSWILVGSPTQEQREQMEPTRQNHALFCIMDMCAAFQMTLLKAINATSESETEKT
jgi:hypothetical protein